MWIQPSLEFLAINQRKTRTALGHHADCYFLLGLRLGTDKNEVSRGYWDSIYVNSNFILAGL